MPRPYHNAVAECCAAHAAKSGSCFGFSKYFHAPTTLPNCRHFIKEIRTKDGYWLVCTQFQGHIFMMRRIISDWRKNIRQTDTKEHDFKNTAIISLLNKKMKFVLKSHWEKCPPNTNNIHSNDNNINSETLNNSRIA